MKRNICVRSMGVGAGIMLIGLAVGAIVSPPLVAQRNGVFGDIQCTGLEVVDKHGRKALAFTDDEKGRWIELFDKQGELAISLAAHSEGKRENAIVVYERGKMAIDLSADESNRQLSIIDKHQKAAILLGTYNMEREIAIIDKHEKPAVFLHSKQRRGNGIAIFEKDNKVWWSEKTK